MNVPYTCATHCPRYRWWRPRRYRFFEGTFLVDWRSVARFWNFTRFYFCLADTNVSQTYRPSLHNWLSARCYTWQWRLAAEEDSRESCSYLKMGYRTFLLCFFFLLLRDLKCIKKPIDQNKLIVWVAHRFCRIITSWPPGINFQDSYKIRVGSH